MILIKLKNNFFREMASQQMTVMTVGKGSTERSHS